MDVQVVLRQRGPQLAHDRVPEKYPLGVTHFDVYDRVPEENPLSVGVSHLGEGPPQQREVRAELDVVGGDAQRRLDHRQVPAKKEAAIATSPAKKEATEAATAAKKEVARAVVPAKKAVAKAAGPMKKVAKKAPIPRDLNLEEQAIAQATAARTQEEAFAVAFSLFGRLAAPRSAPAAVRRSETHDSSAPAAMRTIAQEPGTTVQLQGSPFVGFFGGRPAPTAEGQRHTRRRAQEAEGRRHARRVKAATRSVKKSSPAKDSPPDKANKGASRGLCYVKGDDPFALRRPVVSRAEKGEGMKAEDRHC